MKWKDGAAKLTIADRGKRKMPYFSEGATAWRRPELRGLVIWAVQEGSGLYGGERRKYLSGSRRSFSKMDELWWLLK